MKEPTKPMTQPGANVRKDEITRAWMEGYTRIPMFSLSGLSRLRETGSGTGPSLRWLKTVGQIFAWTLALPLMPAFVGHLLWGSSGPQIQTSWILLIGAALFNFAWVLACALFWHYASGFLPAADELVKSPLLRGEIADWKRRAFSMQWIGWLIVGGSVAAGILLVPELRELLIAKLPMCASVILIAICTVTSLGSVVYLGWVFPDIARRIRFAKGSQLRTFALDTSATPAIRLLVGLITVGSLLLLAVLVLSTAVWVALQVFGVRVSGAAVASIGAIIVLDILVLVRTVTVPTWHLYVWISESKSARLKSLDRSLSASKGSTRSDLVGEFFQVAATEDGPFKSSTLVQFGAAVAATVLAFGFTFIYDVLR